MLRRCAAATLLVVSPFAISLFAQPPSWTTWFTDGFSDGTYQRWTASASEPGARWAIEDDPLSPGNKVLAGYGSTDANLIPVQGGDFRFRARVMVNSGAMHFSLRNRDCGLRYYVEFSTTRVMLGRTSPCAVHTELVSVNEAHTAGAWYDLEVILIGATVKVKVGGVQKIDYTDATPVLFGGIWIHSLSGSTVKVDDVEVTGPPRGISMLNTDLPDATAGVAYAFALSASGGTGPLTWGPAPGFTMPAGLGLSSSGTLSGTLASPGNYEILATVSDTAGNQTFKDLYLQVNALGIQNARALPIATQGVPYSAALVGLGGGGGYTWSSNYLPCGLNLNPSTGVISGTPNCPGNHWFNITVSAGANTYGKTMGIYVNASSPSAPIITLPNWNSAPVGQDMSAGQQESSFDLIPRGGTAPFTWSIVSGSLPPGTNLVWGSSLLRWTGPHNAMITGWPTAAGTYNFTVQVTDSAARSSTRAISLTVSWLRITNGPPDGMWGASYPAFTFTAVAGVRPYSWSALSGLAAGMSLSPAGVLSGTPVECGEFFPIIRVADSLTPAANALRRKPRLFIACVAPPASTITIGSVTPITGAAVGRNFNWNLNAYGGNGNYTWMLNGGSLPPGMVLETGIGWARINGTPTTGGSYTFQLRVTDTAGGVGIRNLTVLVSPVIVLRMDLPRSIVGVSYSAMVAANGGTPPYTYSTDNPLPPGLTLNSATGEISGTPAGAGGWGFNIIVQDASGNITYAWYNLNVDAIGITTNRALPLATQGTPYSVALAQVGGTGPCTWSANNLPQGISIDPATGVISGTPTGWSNFQVWVGLNCASGSASGTFGLIVQPVPWQMLNLQGNNRLEDATLGGQYFSQNLFVHGGAPPYSWTLTGGSLPPGLNLLTGSNVPSWYSPYSVAIGGWPTALGDYTFTLTGSDSGGASLSRTFTIHVSRLNITSPQPPNGTLGTPYTYTFNGSGGTPPYAWSVSSGILPSGLTLNPTTGVLSGTPTESGWIWFEVKISDSTTPANFYRRAYNIFFASGTPVTLDIQPGKDLQWTLGYNERWLNVGGGTAPYTWSLAPGSSLPPGMELVQTGGPNQAQLRGTLTTPGAWTFTIQVTDSAGSPNLGRRTYVLTVTPLVFQNSGNLINAAVGGAYGRQFTVTGGTGPYTWSLAPYSSLPNGMTLSSTGLLSGVPTLAGNYGFSIVATDATGQSFTFGVSLTVDALNITTAGALPTGVQNTAYSVTLGVTGGTAPYTWNQNGGGLPGGISLSSAGVLSGTSGGTGNWNFNLRVTDSGGKSATRNFSLIILGPPSTPSPLKFDTGPVGSDMSLGRWSGWGIFASGGTPPYTFSLEPGSSLPPGLFLLQGQALPTWGNPTQVVLEGPPTAVGNYSFTLRVTDNAGSFALRTFTRRVSPLGFTSGNPPGGTLGVPYSFTFAASGCSGACTFSSTGNPLPKGLSLNAASGVLSGTPAETGNVNFSLKVTDGASNTITRSYNLNINSNTAVTLPINGLSRSNTFFRGNITQTPSSAGGASPYTWSVIDGALPPGVFLLAGNATNNNDPNVAQISGVPTAPGVYTFTVQIADSSTPPNIGIESVTWTVSTLAPMDNNLYPASAGASYSTRLQATGGTAPYTFTLDPGSVSLPAGTTLASDGTLSGTPTTPGGYDLAVNITDSATPPITVGMTFRLNVYKINITTAAFLPVARNNTAYTTSLVATGGTGGYTWSMEEGGFPGGVSLNSSTGVISGTSGCGGNTWNIRIRATDSSGIYAIKRFTFPCLSAIPTPPRFNTPSVLSDATANQSYGTQISVADGQPPYTVALAGGSSLPSGLMLLNGDQLPGNAMPGFPYIWGRVFTAGNYTFTLTATDANSATVSRTFSLHVTPLSIGELNIKNGTRNAPYSQQFVGGNGTPAYTWSAVSLLPGGLALSPSGLLSGTPTDSGSYNISVKITGNSGDSYTRTYNNVYFNSDTASTININTGPQLGDCGFGICQYRITAGGGTMPYTWSQVGGALPPGMFLLTGGAVPNNWSSNDAAVAGPASAPGVYTFTLRVIDAGGNTGYRTFTLRVVPLTSIVTQLAPGTIGQPYAQQLVATGCSGSCSWAPAVDTVLPPGLTLSATGLLSGTPTAGGAYSFNVTITSGSQAITLGYSLTVAQTSMYITNAAILPNGVSNTAYSVTLNVSGGASPYTFSMAGGSFPGGVSLGSDGLISGTVKGTGNYSITVRVTDSAGQTNTKVFGLYAVSAAVPRPIVINTAATLTSVSVNQTVNQNLDAGEGTPPYVSWTVVAPSTLPPGLAIIYGNQLSGTDRPGTFRLVGTVPTPGAYTFDLRVTDSASATATRTFTLLVSPLTIMPSNPQNGLLNTPYSAQLLATGGTPSYNWSIASGALPAGLTFSGGGLISGTPLESGAFNFTVRLIDSSAPANVFTRNISLFINSGTAVTLSIGGGPRLSDTTLRAQVGTNISVSGGTSPYTWALAPGSSLPAGLYMLQGTALNSFSGAPAGGVRILGNPQTPGMRTFTLQVTDAVGNLGVRVFNLLVTPLVYRTRNFPVLQSGQPASVTLEVGGGTPPYSWAPDPNTPLPPGMSLSGGGVLSGTPGQNGSFNFNATAADLGGNTFTQNFTVNVRPVRITTDYDLGVAQTGSAFSVTFASNGGTAPITWSTSWLPNGLTLSSNGTLSGTPVSLGNYTFSITATDAAGWSTSKTFHLALEPPGGRPMVMTTTSPLAYGQMTVGLSWDSSLIVNGGTPPYTWSIAPGSSLPPGLSILQGASLPVPQFTPGLGAALSGVLATVGTYTFTLRATDNSTPPITLSRTYTVEVTSLATSPSGTMTGTVGSPFLAKAVASGGTAPYTYTIDYPITRGALPPGLTMTPDGTVSGTPTDAGSSTSIVWTATDSSTPPKIIRRTMSFSINPASQTGLKWTLGGRYIILQNLISELDLSASGGAPPYTFSAVNEALLPPGMVVLGTSLIGMPTVPGNYTIPLRVTDSAAASQVLNLNLEVVPVGATPVLVPYATVGVPYSQAFAFTGGTAPIQFTVGDQLPPGMSFNAAGVLSGTPTTAGMYNTRLFAYDSSSPVTLFGDGFAPVVVNSSGCSFSPTPASLSVPAAGVAGATINIGTGAGCNWYGWSTVPWIRVRYPNFGTGAGSLQLDVSPNTTPTPRSAAVQIGGQTYNVLQAASAPASASTLSLVGGIVGGQAVSPAGRSITVAPGATVTGSFDVRINSAYPSGTTIAMAMTPTWGSHSTSFTSLSAFTTPATNLIRTVPVSFTAPATQGSYYLIVAYGAEASAAYLMSATSSSAGSPVWDSNDIAGWSSTTIDATDAAGNVLVDYLYAGGNIPTYVAATAIRVIVGTPPGPNALRFVPITPCRAVDTRNPAGPLGGPRLPAGTRDFPLLSSACGIPSSAQAYSLNVTVVPQGMLGYLSIWPSGQSQPLVSTLNSLDGRIKANAAIVPVGAAGAVSVYVTNPTDVIIDVNGYFVPVTTPSSLSFYPITPCRVSDTRNPDGPLGGPMISGGTSRSIPVPSSTCGLPANASAYSLNFTVVPRGMLGYITTWPTGTAMPLASTLNALTGAITANAAIVPAGTGGAISVFASNDTDVIMDVNGYFAPPGGVGAMSFYAATPCRVLDTRNAAGPLGGPALNGQRDFPVSASACGVPASAQAYSLSATVVPAGMLGYLSLWPWGAAQPLVSTLNALDGSITSNAAIVPASSGKISAYATNQTDLILDVNGYFAP